MGSFALFNDCDGKCTCPVEEHVQPRWIQEVCVHQEEEEGRKCVADVRQYAILRKKQETNYREFQDIIEEEAVGNHGANAKNR